MNFANFASFAISISVNVANFAYGWCESDGILWCILLLISSFPQITIIARIFSLRDVYGLQSQSPSGFIYFSRSFSPTDSTDFFALLKILATLGNLSKLNCPCLSQEFLDFLPSGFYDFRSLASQETLDG